MRRAALALFVAAALPLAFPARGQAPPASAPPGSTQSKQRVLVTAFEPFDGRSVNNSARIAEALRAHPSLPSGLEVTVCILPVVYDVAADRAMDCLNAMEPKPSFMLSLGEAGCSMQLETSAARVDHNPGLPDNAGNIRENHVSLPDGPPRIGYDFPVQALYCALTEEDRPHVRVSATMDFVCQNTGYHLANRMRGSGIPYGFIHVPTAETRCGERSDPHANAGIIARFLGALLAHEREVRPVTYALPHCSNAEHLPSSLEEVARVAAALAEAEGVAACETEFLEKVKEQVP